MAHLFVSKKSQPTPLSMPNLHTHTFYEIYYLTSGNRLFFLSDTMYELSAPAIVIIPPYTPHKTEGDSYERYDLYVSPAYLSEFQKELLKNFSLKSVKPNTEESEVLAKLLDELNQMQVEKKHEEIIHAVFSYFLVALSKLNFRKDAARKTASQKVPPTVLKIISYMDAHYAEKITLSDLSRRFFMAKATLNYHFNRAFSYSPIDYLIQIRLTKAKQMLCETNESVGRIALACGFPSANYFGLMFKKKEGLSPTAFRKKSHDGDMQW